MRALLLSIGTRGDAEPFLALAEILENHGWEITCVFPEQFRSMVEECNIQFIGFDKKFLELLNGSTARSLMGGEGSVFKKLKALIWLSRSSWRLQDQLLETQKISIDDFSPDLIFYHPKCVYPLLWEIQRPGSTILVSPIPCIIHPVKEYATIGIRGNGNYGPFLNMLSYRLMNHIRSHVFYLMTKRFRKKIKTKISAGILYKTLVYQTKTLYSISENLFPRPDNWSDHVHITGFLERNRTLNWTPDSELVNFLDHHRKVLFITFGSMTNGDPEGKTHALVEVLNTYQIPAIINTSWGGLQQIEGCPGHILFVNNIPYDWIFPKVYAVVHHGGSGTTHTAVKYGCPSLIIPHIVDQFFWNNRIAFLKLGPKGVAVNKLNTSSLTTLLVDLWQNQSYKENVLKMSQQMNKERSPEKVLSLIS